MEKEKLKIKVIDVGTGQTLFECQLTEAEKALNFAAQMEEIGVDVEIQSPTLSETLTDSLGFSEEKSQKYKESLDEEMEQHEGSCCFEDNDDKKNIH